MASPVWFLVFQRMSDIEERFAGNGVAHYLFAPFGMDEATSFWKRGSFRSGSNIGSSRSNAGVSGTLEASAPAHGIESSLCKAAMARSGSPTRAATRSEALSWESDNLGSRRTVQSAS